MAVWRKTTYTEDTPNNPPLNEAFWERNAQVERVVTVRKATPQVRYQAYQDFLGFSQYVRQVGEDDGVVRAFISRTPPHALPAPFASLSGQQPFLHATRVQKTEMLGLRGVDPPSGLSIFDACKISLQYTSLRWDVLSDNDVQALGPGEVGFNPNYRSPIFDPAAFAAGVASGPDEGQRLAMGTGRMGGGSRWVFRDSRPSSKILTVPRGLMRYVGIAALGEDPTTGAATLEGLPFEEVRIDLEYTWFEVPYAGFPIRAIINCLNTVSNFPFDGYPGGTLMLKAAIPDWYKSRFGDWYADVKYGFAFAPHITTTGFRGVVPQFAAGWNYFLGTGLAADGTRTVGYRPVTSDGTAGGNFAFRQTDFADLFRPDQPT